jgi:alpha-mannosidase
VHADAEEVFKRVGAELERRIEAILTEMVPRGADRVWLANSADAPIDGIVVLPREAATLDSQELADGTVAVGLSAAALSFAPLKPVTIADRVVLSDSSMTNGHLAVRWDRLGNITSVIDIERAREIVPPGSYAAALELAQDHPVEYDAWDLESWTRQSGAPLAPESGRTPDVVIDDTGPLVGRVTVKRWFGPSSVTVTYELRAGEPQLYVHVDLDWNHDEHLLSMAFPIDVRADVAMCDVQLGVVARPTHPSSPWDAAKFEVCAHRFVDLAEPGFGVAVLNTGRYGHCVFDGAIRVSLARAAKYPDPTADRGHHSVTLALRPHGPGLADVRAAASRLNSPVRVVAQNSHGAEGSGNPNAVASGRPLIDVTGDGVEIDAVKLADDDSGDIIVRLHEACGNRVRVSVRAFRRIGAAWQCDLLEVETTGEEVTDGIVALPLRPFQLVTLRLRLAADFDGR